MYWQQTSNNTAMEPVAMAMGSPENQYLCQQIPQLEEFNDTGWIESTIQASELQLVTGGSPFLV